AASDFMGLTSPQGKTGFITIQVVRSEDYRALPPQANDVRFGSKADIVSPRATASSAFSVSLTWRAGKDRGFLLIVFWFLDFALGETLIEDLQCRVSWVAPRLRRSPTMRPTHEYAS